MRTFAAILVSALAALQAHADVRLFAWQESRDEKAGEKQFGFYLAPSAVMKFMEADVKGDRNTAELLGTRLPEDAWAYGFVLTGESGVYSREKVALFESGPCGSVIEIASGSVEVDWRAKTVRVGLKVIQDGKPTDFTGNGAYRIRKTTDHADGSTRTSVTPASDAADPRVMFHKAKPVVGGDSLDRPFVLAGTMTEKELRAEEECLFWISHEYLTPGVVSKYEFLSSPGRKIDAVYFKPYGMNKEVCYYFEVTKVVLRK